ncbi:MAG: cytochrome C [Alphaproteobacteria bacterium]|nr:cytochrome C [Alphaproteobacteria bacterium]
MKNKSSVLLFMDNDEKPFGVFETPIHVELNTKNLSDGDHVLKIVSKDPLGIEGIRKIPFVVRNGPAITIEGIKENEVVDGTLPLMINAYSKGDQKKFLIEGSESLHSIPSWLWAIIIIFVGWAIFYAVIAQHTLLK